MKPENAKPFDLEAAKRGEPLIARGGEEVKFISHVPEADEDSRLVVLRGGRVIACYENGNSHASGESDYDLFMSPKKRTVWVNFYVETKGGYYYNTEAEANESAARHFNRLGSKAYPVEIEK